MKQPLSFLYMLLLASLFQTASAELKVVQIYKQGELINWINKNQHLNQVVLDNCQLVEDIQARAEIIHVPAYQFLWGDMLAWGVCVDKQAELGMYYIEQAANQGLAAALEQMGRYYYQGVLVQKDVKRALEYLREGAAGGHLKAQILLVNVFNAGYGSPLDFEDAYHWLHNSVIDDPKLHKQAAYELALLAEKMPAKIVKRAKRPLAR